MPSDSVNPTPPAASSLTQPEVVTLPRRELEALSPKRGRQELPESIEARRALTFYERRWVPMLVYIMDALALQASLWLGWVMLDVVRPLLVRIDPAIGGLKPGQYGQIAAVLAVMPIVHLGLGLNPGYGVSVVEQLRRRVQLIAVLFIMLTVWDFFIAREMISRGVLLLTFGFAVVLGPLTAALTRAALIRARCWGRPVVVLGAGGTAQLLLRLLKREPELGLVPIAVFDDDPSKWDTPVEGVPVLGPIARAKSLPGEQKVELALMAMPSLPGPQAAQLCARLPYPRVMLIPDLIGVASLWVRSRDLGGIIGLEVRKKLFERRMWVLKRSVDWVLGLPMFLLSLPILAGFGLWIKIVSPRGPVIFKQERVGLGGKTIRVYKLRTMYPDAEQRLQAYLQAHPDLREQWEHNCKLKDDPRILPGVGKVLRRTSLDELPQLLNVLKGEMSLVGPRPFPRYHLDKFPARFRTTRRSVLPGLTGLWQVTERSDADVALQEVLDTYYVRNWSLWLDLYVLLRTVGAVVFGRGAY